MDEVMEQVFELILTQYQYLHVEDDEWEIAYLRDESEKGIPEFGKACRVLFGRQLSKVLYRALENARELNEHALNVMTDSLNEEDSIVAILVANELAAACEVIHQLQQLQKCHWDDRSIAMIKETANYAELIRKKLDPNGVFDSETQPIIHM